MNVIENIFRIMKEKMMLQSVVAERAGYTPQIFADMLSGKENILSEDIVKISLALNVTPNDLFCKSA